MRITLILLIVASSLFLVLSHKPFDQDPRYHDFADQRSLVEIPNFADVISNLPFLLVGAAGFTLSLRTRVAGATVAWTLFFGAVALVSLGSAYYHWNPNNNTLVWDRLPMTIGFMAMFVAVLSESIDPQLGRILLFPALLTGLASVIVWHFCNDLRFYVWVQFMPLLVIPCVLALFRSRFSHQFYLLLALLFYLSAKVFESYDRQFFSLTHGLIAGHAIKHLMAAMGCLMILIMLRKRKKLPEMVTDIFG